MEVYSGERVRNVGVTGHGNTGKTQLTTALLYTAGAAERLTGAPVTDFDEEEIEREITIWSGLAHAEWKSLHAQVLGGVPLDSTRRNAQLRHVGDNGWRARKRRTRRRPSDAT